MEEIKAGAAPRKIATADDLQRLLLRARTTQLAEVAG
jgi:hypothetical protein